MLKILDGKKLSEKISEKLRKQIEGLKDKPVLAIVQIGDVAQSSSYIERKKIFADKIGAKVHHIILPIDVSEDKVLELIKELNNDAHIHGVIVQLPIPKHLDRYSIIEAIRPEKDVDGLTSRNAGLIYESAFGGADPKNIPQGLIPATAKGVIKLLKENKISLSGKKALVVGRSLLVGKPVAMLLLSENATVTVAHKKTKNLPELCKVNEIIVVAAGKANLLDKKCFNKNHVIVDVGTNALKGPKTLEEVPKRKLVGDVNFIEAKKIVKALSPVPGGVGPMTVASLFENLLEAYNSQV